MVGAKILKEGKFSFQDGFWWFGESAVRREIFCAVCDCVYALPFPAPSLAFFWRLSLDLSHLTLRIKGFIVHFYNHPFLQSLGRAIFIITCFKTRYETGRALPYLPRIFLVRVDVAPFTLCSTPLGFRTHGNRRPVHYIFFVSTSVHFFTINYFLLLFSDFHRAPFGIQQKWKATNREIKRDRERERATGKNE